MSSVIGGEKTLRVKEFRASGVFTVPPGLKTVDLFMVGAGGGTGAQMFAAAQGGNVVSIKFDVSGKESCAVVIGAGSVGGAGGDTSFDGVAIAKGGAANGLASASVAAGQVGHDCGGAFGFGGNGTVAQNGAYAWGKPGNGSIPNSAGADNTGAGASGAGFAGGSGYLRVEWYE